jgi:ATP-dependent Clp protease adaptor protein ClpS
MADPTRPEDGGTVTVPKTRSETRTRLPDLYKVLLHNDDYTTQEFVDFVLVNIFNHDAETAHRIMLNVHMRGVGVAGIYPWEIAETKAARATSLAREQEYPLLITIEPE